MLHVENIGPGLWRLSGIPLGASGPLPTVVGNYSVVRQIATMLVTREGARATLVPLFRTGVVGTAICSRKAS